MREWWSRLWAVLRCRCLDEDLQAEIDSHLQMEVDARVDRGLSPTEAVDSARRQFGNRTGIREASREAWAFHRLESIVQDARYGLRVLRRSPGFTLTATVVIALGIGAVTSTFTLLDHVLLRPLPFAQPERLVLLRQTNLAEGGSFDLISPPNFLDLQTTAKSFESMGAYLAASLPVNLSGQGTPIRLDSTLVTVDVFRTLGVQPAAGRAFTAEDGTTDGTRVVLVSNGLALTLFGNAVDAVGRTLSLDHQAHTIVGVMPPSFVFPRPEIAVWRPFRLTAPALLANRSNHILLAVARLHSGVSLERARVEMELITGQLQRAYPKDNAKSGFAVIDLRDLMSPQARMLVLGVFGAALCLMLIACTNLANLLFARAVVRKPEMAIRVAAGASRGRLVRQLLTESVVLAGIGGIFGGLLSMTATPLLARLAPNGTPVAGIPEVDVRVLVFAALLTLLTSVLFGVRPALRSCRRPDLQALRSRSASGGSTDRLRAGLVLAEVAGCVILLVGTGLLLKALWRVQAVDPGFRAAGVLTIRTALPTPKYSEAAIRRDFYSRILTDVRALPGVTSAAYVSYHPMEQFSGRFQVLAPGVVDDPLEAPGAVAHFVTSGYFTTLGIPVRRGRAIDERDDGSAPQVAVISESLAASLWPAQDPIGRRVIVAGDRTIVGVVGNISVRSLEGPVSSQIYFPAEQLGAISTYYAPRDLLIRTSGDPFALAPSVQRIIREVDPEQAISNLRPLTDIVSLETAPRRDQLMVLATFAAIAFLLAAVGIHGLLSFTVSARTHEIGVRVALGAVRSTILRMFLRQGLTLGIAGVVVGLPLAYVGARGLGALLFGVEPGDPMVYGPAALLALTLAVTGSLLPALRAAAIDPAITMRTE
jgi:predicted permease